MFTRSSNENACDPTSSFAMINKGKEGEPLVFSTAATL